MNNYYVVRKGRNTMTPRSSGKIIICVFVLMACLFIGTTANAGPGLDIIAYGKAHFEGTALGATDSGFTIALRVNGVELCSYVMGSDTVNGDYYVLAVPTENGLNPGCTYPVGKESDEAYIYINGEPIQENPVKLSAPGIQQELNIHASHDNRVEVPSAASCEDIEAVGLVCELHEQCSDTVQTGGVINQNPAAGEKVQPGSTVSLTLSTGPCPVTVPAAASCEALTALGLVCNRLEQCSATVSMGGIISQSPAAGTLVQPGSAVSLTVSTGPCQVAVPTATSCEALTALGLVCNRVEQCSDTVAAGSIISQNPAAGTMALLGSTVSLVMSSGACPITVPTATTCEAITTAGFVCNRVEQCSDTVAAGGVINQNPAAGSSAPRGSTINLILSSGPCHVTMPDVVSLKEAQARDTLLRSGLNVSVQYQASTQPKGTVLAQTPAAGTSVDVGSAVSITVAANNAPTAGNLQVTTGEDTPATIPFSDYDLDGDLLYVQVQSGPAHGTIAQSASGGREVILYTPNQDYHGADTFTYRYYDGELYSGTATVQITVNPDNDAPKANAGQDLANVPLGAFELDGSGSTDVDGDSLTYLWTVVDEPQVGAGVLDNPQAVKPVLTITRYGTYRVELVVHDGTVSSTPDTVVITTGGNVAPVANAGSDVTAGVNQQVCLDGSRSSDANGDKLTYAWSITTRPTDSQAQLDDATVVDPCFTPDKAGEYVIQLIVNDGHVNSAADTVTVSVQANLPPVAYAGADQTANTSDRVCLNGRNSFDPEGHALTYRWAILTAPSGSGARLDSTASDTPCFTPDVTGDYVIQLIVHDGVQESNPDTVTVRVSNDLPPVADAGDDKTGYTTRETCLDGTGSYDPEGQSLTYKWTIISAPEGSTETLDTNTAPDPCFFPDLPGEYVFQLVVNDGVRNSAPATVTLTAQVYVPIRGDIDQDGDVDKDDVAIITADRNKPLSTCPACDLDGDGKITVLDARIAVTLCTRASCACK